MGKISGIIAVCSVLFFMAGAAGAQEQDKLFNQVEKLQIQRQGYVLGAQLTKAQQEIAAKNPLEAASKKVFKFRDKNLNIVADNETFRILVMFEQFEKLSQQQVQEKVGELFMAYEDPTISAHDKVVYWAWGKKEKFTAAQYDMAREKKKKLTIIATVKFNSEIKIMDTNETQATGDVYFIISSDPLLKFFHDS
ncbi:MAG: hypothetical protein DRH26_14020 [Deltaproteobacteria bacterium]|nr:MAG: hypothetical protein DRH26_14020 [Deltaproteobacteria bacterium]